MAHQCGVMVFAPLFSWGSGTMRWLLIGAPASPELGVAFQFSFTLAGPTGELCRDQKRSEEWAVRGVDTWYVWMDGGHDVLNFFIPAADASGINTLLVEVFAYASVTRAPPNRLGRIVRRLGVGIMHGNSICGPDLVLYSLDLLGARRTTGII